MEVIKGTYSKLKRSRKYQFEQLTLLYEQLISLKKSTLVSPQEFYVIQSKCDKRLESLRSICAPCC